MHPCPLDPAALQDQFIRQPYLQSLRLRAGLDAEYSRRGAVTAGCDRNLQRIAPLGEPALDRQFEIERLPGGDRASDQKLWAIDAALVVAVSAAERQVATAQSHHIGRQRAQVEIQALQ